jgi:alkanesulfonate monooxygenase SsuD/methylene tetrahydromethanopterin reductase-like flavin-dependent oxidoreductase (luciferase family)
MKFGIYSEMQCPPNKSQRRLYWEVQRQIEHADEVGFDTYALVDHHNFPEFSICPNPLGMFASVAQTTKRIRFRTSLHIIPLQNPIRLAGDIAALDVLTNGRMEVGVGRGHAWVYNMPNAGGIPMSESKERLREGAEILKLALTQENFSYHGKFYQVENCTVVPRPVQKEFKFSGGGTSKNTYEIHGKNGWAIGIPILLPDEKFIDGLNTYVEQCKLNGHEPEVHYMRLVYIDENEKRIREDIEEHCLQFVKGNASPMVGVPKDEKALREAGFDFYAEGILNELAEKLTYDDMIEQGIIIAGTPKQVIRKIEEAAARIPGFAEMTMLCNYGGMDHWKAIKTQELMATKVMPYFK